MTRKNKTDSLSARYKNIMKKALSMAASILLIAAALDLLILFTALGQIALENRTGEWAPFWRVQAEFVVNLLQ